MVAFVAFYPSDWLAGTRGLSAAETGVYITLIALMYERGGSVERDDARLGRVCGTTKANFKRALDVLLDEGKIQAEGTALTNSRVSEELKRAQNLSSLNAEKANARWKKNQQKQTPENAAAMPGQCKPEPEPELDDYHTRERVQVIKDLCHPVMASPASCPAVTSEVEPRRWATRRDFETFVMPTLRAVVEARSRQGPADKLNSWAYFQSALTREAEKLRRAAENVTTIGDAPPRPPPEDPRRQARKQHTEKMLKAIHDESRTSRIAG